MADFSASINSLCPSPNHLNERAAAALAYWQMGGCPHQLFIMPAWIAG
jgi:hypothetical protein